ncbi:hypothetical protein ON010_g13975 [Phytophthora cinnamomi]|nr:hypothetical protein ON010_g13975 [Phytophthora cinnamomi]
MTLGQILQRLKETYCSSIGVQYMHMLDRDQCNWIRAKMEHLVQNEESKEKKLHVLERLAFSVVFERFLGNKYNTTKRFGLDGAESLIPGLKFMIDRGTQLGMEHLVIGMPHRGRLNVLSNVIRKPIQQIFKEFQGTHIDVESYNEPDVEDWSNSGDVKYHLGTSYDRAYPDGRLVHLSLVANPSHLEAVDPVVVGKVRAKQFYLGNDDEAEKKVMPLLLHGDAAFSGQGVVYETMHLSGLDNYDTGGTVHVVVNNQIGFTTDPKNSRSSQYCTDLGKAMDVPILHVNGDDPLSVVKVFEFAAEWRREVALGCDHQPDPLMYKKIGQMKSVLDTYIDQQVASGAVTKEECDAIVSKVWNFFQTTFEETEKWEDTKKSDWLANRWDSFKSPNQQSRIRPTGVHMNVLKHVGEKISTVNPGFKVNRQLDRIMTAKKNTIESGEGIDWGTAEAMAWGTLLLEGNHVRISGQDVERGTFSHRHSVLHDQETNNEYVPLNHLATKTIPSAPLEYKTPGGDTISDTQAEFVASNSSLSEFGVLGFELGYSLENPNALVMWEAQFGDFANALPAEHGRRPERGAAHGRGEPNADPAHELAGGVLLHSRAVLPRAASSDPPRLPQAADLGAAQTPAASAPGLVEARGHGGGHAVPAPDPGGGAGEAGGGRQGQARHLLLGQDLLRACPGARREGHQGRGHRARGADRAVPVRQGGGAGRSLPERRHQVGAGGAAKHGLLDVRVAAYRDGAHAAQQRLAPTVVCRPRPRRRAGTGYHAVHQIEQDRIIKKALKLQAAGANLRAGLTFVTMYLPDINKKITNLLAIFRTGVLYPFEAGIVEGESARHGFIQQHCHMRVAQTNLGDNVGSWLALQEPQEVRVVGVRFVQPFAANDLLDIVQLKQVVVVGSYRELLVQTRSDQSTVGLRLVDPRQTRLDVHDARGFFVPRVRLEAVEGVCSLLRAHSRLLVHLEANHGLVPDLVASVPVDDESGVQQTEEVGSSDVEEARVQVAVRVVRVAAVRVDGIVVAVVSGASENGGDFGAVVDVREQSLDVLGLERPLLNLTAHFGSCSRMTAGAHAWEMPCHVGMQ